MTRRQLLKKHCPILCYHSEELYGVVAVEAMTDFFFDGGPGAPRWTSLKREGERSPIAEAKPGSEPALNAGLLASSESYSASPDDYLDFQNLAYAADAAVAQRNPKYGHVIYGTVAERGDGAGCWLQYWFFYIFNSKAALRSNLGVHEGDWEMIQVRLDTRDAPDEVTYAQHRGGQWAYWSGRGDGIDEVEVDGDRPIVYVALGSHASYMRPGRHPIKDLGLFAWAIDDVADGQGLELLDPKLRMLPHDSPPTWVRWPGRWGASITGKFKSPTGPDADPEGKWAKPDAFHASADPFRALSTGAESGLPPRHPEVRARRRGGLVHISYAIPFDDEGMWSAELLLTTHHGDDRVPEETVYLVNGLETEPEPTPTRNAP